MLKSFNIGKVYLQCGIVIQREVTKHGLPSVQLSRKMNLKIEFAKNKLLVSEYNLVYWDESNSLNLSGKRAL